MGDFGRRWTTHASDIDSDYRREMATSGSGLHTEARVRGGSRANLVGDDEAVTTREEEHRKVLQIEEERLRREREAQHLRQAAGSRPVSRSASRATNVSTANGGVPRTAHVQPAGPRGFRPARHLFDDHESQYSGHSSSSTMLRGKDVGGGAKLSRYDQHRVGGRVRRTASNATNTAGNVAAMHGARREINRKKMPGSLTSSVNSSESEQGGAAPSAISRATSAGQRSVFLHAAAVADIPSTGDRPPPPAPAVNNAQSNGNPSRALSADSRRDVNLAAGAGAINAQQSNLKGSKKISRSISLLAPWKPRPVKDKFEIHYDNSAVYSQSPATSVTVGKPPRPPLGAQQSNPNVTVSRRPLQPSQSMHRQDKSKSISSHDLLQDDATDLIIETGSPEPPPSVLVASQQRSKTLPAGKAGKVSRSVSMPKDTRIAGWFKKRKRV